MAKKKETKVSVDPRSAFLKAAMDVAKKGANSKTVYLASDHHKTLYGIPLPSLSLEYLFTSNVLLMSKMIGLAGKKGSCKSSLGFEFLRWVIEWYGVGALVETENKLSEQFINVLQGYADYCQVNMVSSTQAAQTAISKCILQYTKDKTMGGAPMCILIDSLTGSEGDATKEGIFKEGHAVKNYPENAQLWTTWLRAMSSTIVGTALLIIFTNHSKDKVGGTGPAAQHQKTKPGGASQDFHATYYFDVAKKKTIESVRRPGNEIIIMAEKNSMGPDKHKISAEFLWWYKDGDRHNQTSYWDWYAATAKMLVDPNMPAAMHNVVKLKCVSNKYSSKILGFEDLTATEAGYFVENCPAYRKEIQAALNIPLRYVWDQGNVISIDKCDRRLSINLPEGTISQELVDHVTAFNQTILDGAHVVESVVPSAVVEVDDVEESATE